MSIKTKRQAVAQHLGMDSSEMEDYRYHYGHTSQPVYALDDTYYCAVKKGQKPATHREGMDWKWTEVKDDYVNGFGYKIFKHGK